MSTARNILYRGRQNLEVKSLPVHETSPGVLVTYNEGDLMVLDATSKKVRPIASPAESTLLVGFSMGTNPVKYHGQIKPPCVGVYIGRATVRLIAADEVAFKAGTPVYATSDPQTFVVTQPGGSPEPIGKIWQEAVEFNGASEGTTVIGKEYEIMLRNSVLFTL